MTGDANDLQLPALGALVLDRLCSLAYRGIPDG
jgi:hypothetical protein